MSPNYSPRHRCFNNSQSQLWRGRSTVAVWACGAEATPTAQDWACAITGLLPDRPIVAQVKRSTSIAANRSNAHITSHHSVWDSAGPAWPDCYRSAQLCHQWTTNVANGGGTNFGAGVEEARPEEGPRAGDGVLGEGTASPSPPTRGFAEAL